MGFPSRISLVFRSVAGLAMSVKTTGGNSQEYELYFFLFLNLDSRTILHVYIQLHQLSIHILNYTLPYPVIGQSQLWLCPWGSHKKTGPTMAKQVQIWPNRSSLGQVEIVSQSGPAMVRSSQVQPCAVRSSQVLTVKYGHGELWPATQCYQGLAVAGNAKPTITSQVGPVIFKLVQPWPAMLSYTGLVQPGLARPRNGQP